MRIAAAATLYFAIVFGAGFLLGAIRVVWLEPRIGPIVAVLCEAPFILTFIVAAAHWVPRVVKMHCGPAALVLMGMGALVLQQLADLVVGIGLRGNSPAEQLSQFTRPEGRIYALLLLAFAFMPLGIHQLSAKSSSR
jgi:hypothetical protein